MLPSVVIGDNSIPKSPTLLRASLRLSKETELEIQKGEEKRSTSSVTFLDRLLNTLTQEPRPETFNQANVTKIQAELKKHLLDRYPDSESSSPSSPVHFAISPPDFDSQKPTPPIPEPREFDSKFQITEKKGFKTPPNNNTPNQISTPSEFSPEPFNLPDHLSLSEISQSKSKKIFTHRKWCELQKFQPDKNPKAQREYRGPGILCTAIVESTVWGGCVDGTICIWHIKTGKLIGSRQAHKGRIFTILVVDGLVWTASDDNKIRIWTPFAVFSGEINFLMHPKFRLSTMTRGGRHEVWCGGSSDRMSILVISTRTLQTKEEIEVGLPIRHLFLDEEYIWVCSENEIQRMDRSTRQVKDTMAGVKMNTMIAVKDHIWAGSSDSTITIYDKKTASIVHIIKGSHKHNIFSLMQFGAYVWSGGWDNTIYVWNTEDFSLVTSLPGHKDPINSILVVPLVVPVKALPNPKNTNQMAIPTKRETQSRSFFDYFTGAAPVEQTNEKFESPSPEAAKDVPVECTIFSVWSASWDGTVIVWL